MSRHIIDRPGTPAGKAMRSAFLKIDRQERLHPSVRELSRQPVRRDNDGRLRHYLRIDRGQQA